MIDLHSHILPGIDDGAKSDEVALNMARIAANDGIHILACTPHITPGIYDNDASSILSGVKRLQKLITDSGIPLTLVPGADIHVSSEMVAKLQSREFPCLGSSNYFLFEPPHHVAPPNMDQLCSKLLSAGFCPVLTHPERLTWIESHYEIIEKLNVLGVAIQITGASFTGRFGKRAQHWADRMLMEGMVDLVASDAHDPVNRPPKLSEARQYVVSKLGEDVGKTYFETNPRLILENSPLPIKETSIQKTGLLGTARKILTSWIR